MRGHGLDDVLKVRDKWQCLILEFHKRQCVVLSSQ